MNHRIGWIVLLCSAIICARSLAQESRLNRPPTEAIQVNESIYLVPGDSFGNTFMVVTDDGNVIIDTSLWRSARRHRQLLTAISDAPVKRIILTHAHPDHTGGVSLWRGADTDVIAQQNHVEFRHYQHRLRGFFSARNAAQFSGAVAGVRTSKELPTENYGANIAANVLFDKTYSFEQGGLEFQLLHTPGETYDALTVWIPKYKAAFTGDNIYGSFPNMYTLRGTKPRYALDYVESLNKVLDLKPEILLSSHGLPIVGGEKVKDAITRYRDAILYVHDETVKGMNSGKDVFTLMREIRLPTQFGMGEGYGKVSWSVRGIYEGYVGWFDGNPSTMFSMPIDTVHPEIVRMAGGGKTVADRGRELFDEGKSLEALHMADIVLGTDASNVAALQLKLDALGKLSVSATNTIERGWLQSGIRIIEGQLADGE